MRSHTLEGKKKYANLSLNKYRCEKLVREAVKNLLAITGRQADNKDKDKAE